MGIQNRLLQHAEKTREAARAQQFDQLMAKLKRVALAFGVSSGLLFFIYQMLLTIFSSSQDMSADFFDVKEVCEDNTDIMSPIGNMLFLKAATVLDTASEVFSAAQLAVFQYAFQRLIDGKVLVDVSSQLRPIPIKGQNYYQFNANCEGDIAVVSLAREHDLERDANADWRVKSDAVVYGMMRVANIPLAFIRHAGDACSMFFNDRPPIELFQVFIDDVQGAVEPLSRAGVVKWLNRTRAPSEPVKQAESEVEVWHDALEFQGDGIDEYEWFDALPEIYLDFEDVELPDTKKEPQYTLEPQWPTGPNFFRPPPLPEATIQNAFECVNP